MKLKMKTSFKHLQTRPDSVKTCFSVDIFDVLNKMHDSTWNWRWRFRSNIFKLVLTRLKFSNKTCFDIFDVTNKMYDLTIIKLKMKILFKHLQTRPDSIKTCFSFDIFDVLNKMHDLTWNWKRRLCSNIFKLVLTRLKFSNKMCFDIFDITNKMHNLTIIKLKIKTLFKLFSMSQIKRMIENDEIED